MNEKHAEFLDGIRIVEIGRSDAVHVAGMLLADQGAEVVRIEKSREVTDPSFHKTTDRSKKVIIYDPTSSGKDDELKRIMGRADVVLADDSASFELNLLTECAGQSRIIRCTISPFTEGNGFVQGEESDESVSARSGLYEPFVGIGRPLFFDLPIAATLSALYAVNAIAMALVGRARFGCGYTIKVPIDRCVLFSQVLSFMAHAKAPTRWEPFRMWASPFMGVWKTSEDEYIYVHVGMPRHLRSFLFLLDSIGFSDEKKDIKRYLQKSSKRDPIMLHSVREAFAITRTMTRMFKKKKAAEWEELLGNAGLCCTKIRLFDEWQNHPQVLLTNEIAICSSPEGQTVKVPGRMFFSHKSPERTIAPWTNEEITFKQLLKRWPEPAIDHAPVEERFPLEGVKVLDMSRVIAGPFAGRLLAEYGAEVAAVSLRKEHLRWEEPFHTVFSAGKDSITLDYSIPEGKAAFRKIVSRFKPDVVLHNFLEEAAEKIGIDYAACKTSNPDIIYADIQGFNDAGPWGNRPGFEQNVQAASGILSAYSRGGVPRILPVPVNDLCTGLIASFGTALSLFDFFKGKGGNRITSFLSISSILLQLRLLNHHQTAIGESRFNRYFKSSNRWFLLSIPFKSLPLLHALPGLHDLDCGNIARLEKQLASVFRKKKVDFWIRQIRLIDAGKKVTIEPRHTVRSMLNRELGKNDPLFEYVHHEGFGRVLSVWSPIPAGRSGVKKISIAPFFGSSTSRYVEKAGIDPERFRVSIPSVHRAGTIVDGCKRLKWIAAQCKWLLVIAYRIISLRP